MHATLGQDGSVVLNLDTSEYLALNNTLNWVCNGLNGLEGREFDQQIGAGELEVRQLLRVVHGAGDRKPVSLWLTPKQVAIAARVADEVLHGNARLPGARGMSHDWALIGASEADFQRFRAAVKGLATELGPSAQNDQQ